ncbi:MAG: hypothetical protein ACK5HT_09545 [Draconibacterium sp.]
MKPKILKLCIWALLFLIIGAGCQKDELDYADESIVVSNKPGITVYKMNLDYIDKVRIHVTSEGLSKVPILDDSTLNSYNIDSKGNLMPKYRHLLKSGYIVGGGTRNASFTDITFTEYYNYNKEHGVNSWPAELIRPRIIDNDPYEELYWMGCLDCGLKEFTLGQINEMIENGTLEEHFTRMK